ncbi:hypothetical protein MG293_012033 [Ovis ammon polii]|uniref:Uncharacterized protein n=1 Tax=Ovis ammon polii TaxID=230172 RepID=A0AAD4Y5M0_OVIAM|nr:hypothetical protein MG293_012033 [Ovis ammon polii]
MRNGADARVSSRSRTERIQLNGAQGSAAAGQDASPQGLALCPCAGSTVSLHAVGSRVSPCSLQKARAGGSEKETFHRTLHFTAFQPCEGINFSSSSILFCYWYGSMRSPETTSTVSGDHDAEDAVSRRKDTASFFPGLRRTQRLPAKENANCSLCGNCCKGRFTTDESGPFLKEEKESIEKH